MDRTAFVCTCKSVPCSVANSLQKRAGPVQNWSKIEGILPQIQVGAFWNAPGQAGDAEERVHERFEMCPGRPWSAHGVARVAKTRLASGGCPICSGACSERSVILSPKIAESPLATIFGAFECSKVPVFLCLLSKSAILLHAAY